MPTHSFIFYKTLTIAGFTAFTALASHSLSGLGFRIPNQDSMATARGDAFVATADNPSAIYYNPAGLTQLEGTHVTSGAYIVNVRVKYRSPEGDTTKNRNQTQPVPHFYAVHRDKDSPVAWGIGLNAPYGLSNEWSGNVRFREKAIKGRITYISAMPAFAWRINEQLSVGGGPTINYSEAKLVRGTTPGHRAVFEGDDLSIGFNLGLLWQPHTRHSFGVNFRSHDKLNFSGTSDAQPSPPFPGRERGEGSLAIPEFIVVGYSYRPTPEWNFEVNVDWTRWSRLQKITLQTNTFTDEIPFKWESSFMYQVGVTRYFRNDYRISGGYIFSENSVPDENFNPLIPEADRHLASLGFGRKHDRISWEISCQFGYSPTRSIPAAEYPVDGQFQARTAAVAFTANYAF